MAGVTKVGNNYRITVSLGSQTDELTGKRKKIVKTKTYVSNPKLNDKKNKKLAEIEAEKFEQDEKAKFNKNANMTLSYYAELYLENANIKNKTASGYRSYLPRINESIGKKSLCDIKIKDLEWFYKQLLNSERRDIKYTAKIDLKEIIDEKNLTIVKIANKTNLNSNTISNCINGKSVAGTTAQAIAKALNIDFEKLFRLSDSNKSNISNKTIKNYHRFISAVFAEAVHEEILEKNPCTNCRLPFKEIKKEKIILNEQELNSIYKLIEEENLNFKAAITILIESGLRCGELLGLKWDCVNFDKNLITIKRNLCYTREKGVYIDTVKSETSNRIIRLPQRSMNLLKEVRQQYELVRSLMGTLWHEENFVFIRDNGMAMHPHTLGKKFKKFLNKYADELPNISLHSLRHTHASILIEKGFTPVEVSNRLGHSNVSTTMNIYAHYFQKASEKQNNKIDYIFN